MEVLDFSMAGQRFEKDFLEGFLQGNGLTLGGGWEYDHGYYDYVFEKEPAYIVLRIPVYVLEGSLDQSDSVVECGVPFLICHRYQAGVDSSESASVNVGSSMFNQFQSPVEKDGPIQEVFIEKGNRKIKAIEQAIEKKMIM